MTVQQNCPNKTVGPCDWRSPDNSEITTMNLNAAGIALQLWYCFLKNLQIILGNNGMDNTSREMKAVTIKKQNILVNVNNFLFMRQQKAKSIRLYLGRLKRAAHHCDFTPPAGKTSYTDKMLMHTLVQGLEDAPKTNDVMEEYNTNDNVKTRLTIEKIK